MTKNGAACAPKWLVWLPLHAALTVFLTGGFSHGATAQSFLDDTALVGLTAGGELSDTAADIARGGYELADGRRVRMRDWYHSDWTDLHVDFLTRIGPDTGILWGVGTGEAGEKYRIRPSLRLGLIQQFHISDSGLLTLQLAATLGGRLKEKPCVADFGAIGGVQKVNCRLAASPLPPGESLSYLLDEKPYDAVTASITYRLRF